MSDRPSGATGWIRGLFGGGKAETAHQSGKSMLVTGRRALLAAECMFGETVCCPAREAGPDSWAAVNIFGQPVNLTVADDARGAVAAAAGLALAGRRATALVSAGRLTGVRQEIERAAERRLPLVVQLIAAEQAHTAYHTLADSGAIILFARNGQEALDLAMAARRVAELALIPAVVAVDGSETARAVQDLRLPEHSLIWEFLGDPDGEIASPTVEQQLLFGKNRRRMPRWFDLDRPAALGLPLAGGDLDAAIAGRRAFSAGEVAPLLKETLAGLGELTGRELPFVSRHHTDNARHLLVAQGAAIETAMTVTDYLRASESVKIGLLGLSCLRPFPEEEIRAALSQAATVTVLDRVSGSDPNAAPLMAEIRSALRGNGVEPLSATYTKIDAAGILASCRNMSSGEQPRRFVHLGATSSVESSYPRRQALLQRVRRDFPALDTGLLPVVQAPDLRPEGSRTIALYARGEQPPDDLMESLAAALGESVGRHLRSRCELSAPAIWRAVITASGTGLFYPGSAHNANLTLITCIEPRSDIDPLADAAANGLVALASELDGENSWARMPASWRRSIRKKELRLFLFPVEREALAEAAGHLLAGDLEALEEIAWRELPEVGSAEVGERLPLIVRRFGAIGSTYDNVARFWGELTEPRLDVEDGSVAPDPYLALGAVPASTATFHDMTEQRQEAPVVDPMLCAGCGKCWASCPDSAIGSLTIGAEELLNTAASRAEAITDEPPSAAAGKLRSVHCQLAARISGQLAKSEARLVAPELLRNAFDWLMEQMKISEPELPAFSRAFEATLAEIENLPLSATDTFFSEPHREQKGSGELLMLAVNAQSCQGCGICAAVCPEEAIYMEAQTAGLVESMRQTWSAWEELPDTPGKTIAMAAAHPVVGPLSAVLMSRHCLFSVAGGEGAEPGSGERLATRQVAAVIEYQMQRRLLGQAEVLDGLSKRLREAIHARLAEALPVDELESLEEVLGASSGRTSSLSEILSRLEQRGERSDVELASVRRLVRAARAVEQARWRISEGFLGSGRARYGLVVAGRSAADWAARFPRNPFGAPVTVDLSGSGSELALGIIEGLVADRVTEARIVRQAELALEAPSDLPAQERQLASLGWRDLSPEEMVLCPPILVLAGHDGLSGISKLLTSGLPVKLVLLDDCDLLLPGGDPLLMALAHRSAFVLSTSVAHASHLFGGVTAALEAAGPAFIRIHAPSPGRHGFAPRRTLERARLAVDSRVNPLLSYDPSASGVFGSRLSLEGNPQCEQTLASGMDGEQLTPAQWAAGESRYDQYLTSSSGERGSANPTVPGPNGTSLAVGEELAAAAEQRLERWATLQELAGVVTPFTEAVRQQLEEELHSEHEAELSTVRSECDSTIAALERDRVVTQATRLRDRLLQLAGVAAPRSAKPQGEGDR